MQKEIGSEFWEIPITKKKNGIFENVTWFVSGRTALRAVLQQASVEHSNILKKIAIPSFLCESMIQPILKEHFSYSFYRVFLDNNSMSFDFRGTEDCGYILVLDYFGYKSCHHTFPQKKIVIRDVTHSVFSQKYDDAEYYFGSLRKWTGFLTGGFAYKKEGKIFTPTPCFSEYPILRDEAMKKKKAYIEKNLGDKEYLSIFHHAEELLNECSIDVSTSSDIYAAEILDVDLIKRKRQENAKVLIKGLGEYCLFKGVSDDDCPLCVPILVNNRDALRRYLILNEIYCPVHWPKPNQIPNGLSDELYEKELSLVCDQRYNENDMIRIVNAILSFKERKSNA